MTITSGMPAASAVTSRTMAGDMRARPADRLGERQPADFGFDAALRSHDRPERERSEDAGTVVTPETDEAAMPQTMTAAQALSSDDVTAMKAETRAVPLMMLATGQPCLQPALAAQAKGMAAGKGMNDPSAPKGAVRTILDDEAPQADLADMPESGLTARRPAADALMDTRATFRIHLQDWRQSRHFAAPTPARGAEAPPQTALLDAARLKAAADMPVTLPQAAMAPAMADAPLPIGDTEALTGRLLNLARELSPPVVTTRQLDIAIAPPQGGTLAVRLALRGDELQVTLRVPNAAMAERLQREADLLARRLGQAEIHGAARVQVNVVVDPNAVAPAARTDAAHGFMQPPAHQHPMPHSNGQQGQAQDPTAGQGMGGHAGTGPGQGGAMQQGSSSHRHAALMDESADGNGSEARHGSTSDAQAPIGHRRLYI